MKKYVNNQIDMRVKSSGIIAGKFHENHQDFLEE